MPIPVYAFTGFLDSGKTKFIQETLEDPRFNSGERTLLLVFEEGEEEYDFSAYPHQNVYLEVLDQQTVTQAQLASLQKKEHPEKTSDIETAPWIQHLLTHHGIEKLDREIVTAMLHEIIVYENCKITIRYCFSDSHIDL